MATRLRPRGLALLFTLVFSTGCDSNDSGGIDLDDPDSLVGPYRLLTVTDKAGDFSGNEGLLFEAGEPMTITFTEDGESFTVVMTVDADLELTSTRYMFRFCISASTGGFPAFTEVDEDEGTWTVSGNTLTLDSDEQGVGIETLDISADGDRITIEDETARFVFEQE